MLYSDLTRAIIGCAFEVQNELGSGFLESVYEKAMLVGPFGSRDSGQISDAHQRQFSVDSRLAISTLTCWSRIKLSLN